MAFIGSGPNITSLNASNIASGTLSADRLATSGVTAGSYTLASITVDNKGRVTAASSGSSSAPTTNQVLSATAGATAGEVGTYAWLWDMGNTATNVNGTRAGSNFRYSGFSAGSTADTDRAGSPDTRGAGGTPSGTWRCMGRSAAGQDIYGNNLYPLTLWLRIS